jgi:isopentenyl-diphosphate delta-isomerase
LAAVDFGALGGTNFARLEMHRANNSTRELFQSLALTGHTAAEMIQFVNDILNDSKNRIECREVIVSGGMQGFLDGYAALGQLQCKAVYAQGSAFLKHAMGDYSDLETYIDGQTRGLLLAKAFLKVR